MSELETVLTLNGGTPPTLQVAIFSLIAALVLGMSIGAVYVWSYRGMSYTRSYVHAIAIGAVIACMLMQAANNNIVAGIGIAGSLSVLRLRIALRDPKDLVFIFAGVAVGVACGVHAFTVAVAGTLVFGLSAVGMALFEVGQRHLFEGLLRFYAPVDAGTEKAITDILKRYTGRFALITLREVRQGAAMEYGYHVRLRETDQRVSMVRDLEAIEGIDGVTLYYQDATQEL